METQTKNTKNYVLFILTQKTEPQKNWNSTRQQQVKKQTKIVHGKKILERQMICHRFFFHYLRREKLHQKQQNS